MALLADYAITPDVFDIDCHSSDEVCGLNLNTIRQIAVEEGVVRDLRAGQWRSLFANRERQWHRRAKEIVKKLYLQGRLIESPAALAADPTDDRGWCAEGLASHQHEPMIGGVIVTPAVKKAYPREPLVERIDRPSERWRKQRSPSVMVRRTLADYRDHLDLILRYSKSLQFIDPHLDPERSGYGHFVRLLNRAGGRFPPPRIEIHRGQYAGSGYPRDRPDFEPIFRSKMGERLRAAGLSARVFIWDQFHERYLLSNLIGIHLGNGFDTKLNDTTMWNRLGRDQHAAIQRKFDPASQRPVKSFTVP